MGLITRTAALAMMLALFTGATTACNGDALAERGINTVSVVYGVEQTLFGTTITISPGHDERYTDARLELEIVDEDGKIDEREYRIGDLGADETWRQQIARLDGEWDVIRVKLRCSEGAANGELLRSGLKRMTDDEIREHVEALQDND